MLTASMVIGTVAVNNSNTNTAEATTHEKNQLQETISNLTKGYSEYYNSPYLQHYQLLKRLPSPEGKYFQYCHLLYRLNIVLKIWTIIKEFQITIALQKLVSAKLIPKITN